MPQPKCVVFETPKSDETLRGSGINKWKLDTCFKNAFIQGQGIYSDPVANFVDLLKHASTNPSWGITREDAKALAEVMSHFGSKCIIGSDQAQINNRVVNINDTNYIRALS